MRFEMKADIASGSINIFADCNIKNYPVQIRWKVYRLNHIPKKEVGIKKGEVIPFKDLMTLVQNFWRFAKILNRK